MTSSQTASTHANTSQRDEPVGSDASGATGPDQTSSMLSAPVTRRGFLSATSAAAVGVGLAGFVLRHSPAARADDDDAAGATMDSDGITDRMRHTVAFDGEHQAGIATAQQSQCNVVAFTVRKGVDVQGVKNLLTLWTEDARQLTQGHAPLGSLEPEMIKAPGSLTITCGFGRRFFDVIGKPSQRPEWLGPLPKFKRDKLDDAWGPADIMLQICSDDPLTLAHVTRHMIRSSVDYVAVRWMQSGFLPTDGAREKGGTPRNLFGVKDGIVNPGSEEDYDDIVWITEGPAWLKGGSCMIIRRIAMDLDGWEKLDRDSRQVVFGRRLKDGSPLTGTKEFDTPDFNKTDELGLKVIDPNSHMARSHNPDDKPFQKIRRRAYSYDLPPDPTTENTSNSGLLFICYQKNPVTQFAAIQDRLDKSDRLNQWITHIGSAVFACPPGTSPDDSAPNYYWGKQLLEG